MDTLYHLQQEYPQQKAPTGMGRRAVGKNNVLVMGERGSDILSLGKKENACLTIILENTVLDYKGHLKLTFRKTDIGFIFISQQIEPLTRIKRVINTMINDEERAICYVPTKPA